MRISWLSSLLILLECFVRFDCTMQQGSSIRQSDCLRKLCILRIIESWNIRVWISNRQWSQEVIGSIFCIQGGGFGAFGLREQIQFAHLLLASIGLHLCKAHREEFNVFPMKQCQGAGNCMPNKLAVGFCRQLGPGHGVLSTSVNTFNWRLYYIFLENISYYFASVILSVSPIERLRMHRVFPVEPWEFEVWQFWQL